jgi:hypothetical protein
MTSNHFPPANSSSSLEEIIRLARAALTAEEFLEYLQQLAEQAREAA